MTTIKTLLTDWITAWDVGADASQVYERTKELLNPESWQQRLVLEKNALDEQLDALRAFIGDKRFAQLDDINRSLLLSQREWMFRYSDVLEQRIKLFRNPEPVRAPLPEDAPKEEVTDAPPQE